MKRPMACAGSLLLLLTLAGCREEPQPAPTAPVTQPPREVPAGDPQPVDDTEAALQAQIESILAAADGGDVGAVSTACVALALPDPEEWFAEVFGEEAGGNLASDYDEQAKSMGADLSELFADAVAEGRVEVRVTKIGSADDANATGGQRKALEAMARPVALYSVRLVKPGETSGMHIWSFVYVDGAFRLAGKMSM